MWFPVVLTAWAVGASEAIWSLLFTYPALAAMFLAVTACFVRLRRWFSAPCCSVPPFHVSRLTGVGVGAGGLVTAFAVWQFLEYRSRLKDAITPEAKVKVTRRWREIQQILLFLGVGALGQVDALKDIDSMLVDITQKWKQSTVLLSMLNTVAKASDWDAAEREMECGHDGTDHPCRDSCPSSSSSSDQAVPSDDYDPDVIPESPMPSAQLKILRELVAAGQSGGDSSMGLGYRCAGRCDRLRSQLQSWRARCYNKWLKFVGFMRVLLTKLWGVPAPVYFGVGALLCLVGFFALRRNRYAEGGKRKKAGVHQHAKQALAAARPRQQYVVSGDKKSAKDDAAAAMAAANDMLSHKGDSAEAVPAAPTGPKEPEQVRLGHAVCDLPVVYPVRRTDRNGKESSQNCSVHQGWVVVPRHGAQGAKKLEVFVDGKWCDLPSVCLVANSVSDQLYFQPPAGVRLISNHLKYRRPLPSELSTLIWHKKMSSGSVGSSVQLGADGKVEVFEYDSSTVSGACGGLYIAASDGCCIGVHGIGAVGSSKPLFFPVSMAFHEELQSLNNRRIKPDHNVGGFEEYPDRWAEIINNKKPVTFLQEAVAPTASFGSLPKNRQWRKKSQQ